MTARRLDVLLQEDVSLAVPYILDRAGQPIPCLETGARVSRIAEGLDRSGFARFSAPRVPDARLDGALEAVHERGYLEFLARASRELQPGEARIDPSFAPAGVTPDTPLVAGMFDLARESARTALAAALRVAESGGVAYALGRPPGHHAGRATCGGHCYLNNAVVAFHALRGAGVERVAVLDLDFHFGNGTAELLRGRADAFFGSVHASTVSQYPYVETREPDAGQRFIDFADDPGVERFLEAARELVRCALAFRPGALVVSIGYDIVAGDPFGSWALPPSVMEEVGRCLAATGLPLCLVQEGGYRVEHLDECAHRLALGLARESARPAPDDDHTL